MEQQPPTPLTRSVGVALPATYTLGMTWIRRSNGTFAISDLRTETELNVFQEYAAFSGLISLPSNNTAARVLSRLSNLEDLVRHASKCPVARFHSEAAKARKLCARFLAGHCAAGDLAVLTSFDPYLTIVYAHYLRYEPQLQGRSKIVRLADLMMYASVLVELYQDAPALEVDAARHVLYMLPQYRAFLPDLYSFPEDRDLIGPNSALLCPSEWVGLQICEHAEKAWSLVDGQTTAEMFAFVHSYFRANCSFGDMAPNWFNIRPCAYLRDGHAPMLPQDDPRWRHSMSPSIAEIFGRLQLIRKVGSAYIKVKCDAPHEGYVRPERCKGNISESPRPSITRTTARNPAGNKFTTLTVNVREGETIINLWHVCKSVYGCKSDKCLKYSPIGQDEVLALGDVSMIVAQSKPSQISYMDAHTTREEHGLTGGFVHAFTDTAKLAQLKGPTCAHTSHMAKSFSKGNLAHVHALAYHPDAAEMLYADLLGGITNHPLRVRVRRSALLFAAVGFFNFSNPEMYTYTTGPLPSTDALGFRVDTSVIAFHRMPEFMKLDGHPITDEPTARVEFFVQLIERYKVVSNVSSPKTLRVWERNVPMRTDTSKHVLPSCLRCLSRSPMLHVARTMRPERGHTIARGIKSSRIMDDNVHIQFAAANPAEERYRPMYILRGPDNRHVIQDLARHAVVFQYALYGDLAENPQFDDQVQRQQVPGLSLTGLFSLQDLDLNDEPPYRTPGFE